MIESEQTALRAMLVDVMGAAINGAETRLGGQIGTVQSEVEKALDKLDDLAITLGDLGARIGRLESEVRDVKTQLAQLNRKHFRDVEQEQQLRRRVAALENELTIIKKVLEHGSER